MSPEEKNARSHRRKALDGLKDLLVKSGRLDS
jgi:inosine/xanthosine triphosphate pyrophosphatase family protein